MSDWINKWYETNTIDTTDISNGAWTTSDYVIVDSNISNINPDKLTFTFPDGDIELTYQELKVLKRMIEKFGKEMFPEEYV